MTKDKLGFVNFTCEVENSVQGCPSQALGRDQCSEEPWGSASLLSWQKCLWVGAGHDRIWTPSRGSWAWSSLPLTYARTWLWPGSLEILSEPKIDEIETWPPYAVIIDSVLKHYLVSISKIFREKCFIFAQVFLLMESGGWKSYIQEAGLFSLGLSTLARH